MRLPELQNSFTHGILHAPEPRLLALMEDTDLPAKDRFTAYRNNVYSALFDTLKSFFPTVVNLVSDDFFRGVVHHYVKAHPPQSALLDEYGQSLPSFLERYQPALTLPYLPDIARLDWAMHEADIAPNDRVLPREVLQSRMETLAEQKLPLRSAVRLLTTRHPLKEIWNFCQAPDKSKPVEMLIKPHYYVIFRCDDYSLWFEETTSGTFTALKGLMVGQTVQHAFSAATASSAGFEASHLLLFAMTRELLKGD